MSELRPDVCVVVACRNEKAYVDKFIQSALMQETGDLRCEFVIADGRSNDGTRELLDQWSERQPQLRIIDNPQQIVSTGLNAAIAVARAEIILRMDMHTEYASDYIRRCVELLKTTGCENVGGPARTRATGYIGRAIATAYHSPFACGGARFHNENYEGPIDTVPYGCWYRELLMRLGGFDEALVRNQDDEMNLRIVRAGGTIWQSPAIVSWYHPRASLRALFRQYFQYGFWKVAVIRKHSTPGAWRHLVPGAFVSSLALLALTMGIAAAFNNQALFHGAGVLLACAAAIYASAAILAACLAAQPYGSSMILVLPVVFAVYHFSYGTGFLLGSIWWPLCGSGGSPAVRPFSSLSR